MSQIDRMALQIELNELVAKNNEAKSWGAAVGARSKRINEIKRLLAKDSEPFGRQPKPVTVAITGDDPRDVAYWVAELARRAEFKGDTAQRIHPSSFIIYPRAVND